MKPFDSFAAIDWSGAKTISTSSIALSYMTARSLQTRLVHCDEKQQWSRSKVFSWIIKRACSEERTFIGIDANLGYANDIIISQYSDVRSAFDLWAKVDHVCETLPNFYAEFFWKHSKMAPFFWLDGTKPIKFKNVQRETEKACKQQNFGNPENPFKLLGPKQVGKGGLAAMRMAHHLKLVLQDKIAFWPFDTEERIDHAHVVIAEIYPRLFIKAAGMGTYKISDTHSLQEALKFWGAKIISNKKYSDHQTDALIAVAGIKAFLKDSPEILRLKSQQRYNILREGWIFGVKM